ncbi:MAG: hypothetical protein HN368_01135, partial [Spirochaetales bacterium]|nr:hypothetical protein [Spirochaetales bacterium]
MDKELLFEYLEGQKKTLLLELLNSAFDEMKTDQKYSVFRNAIKNAKPLKIDGSQILKKVRRFYEESLTGLYFAPFDINSKNFSNIPEETNEWFEMLNDLLLSSTQLSHANNHLAAIECFSILYELINRMEDGEEIIFADEYGTWMISGDKRAYIKAYISSLAVTKTPEEYARLTAALIR